jgi:hypothetical protein
MRPNKWSDEIVTGCLHSGHKWDNAVVNSRVIIIARVLVQFPIVQTWTLVEVMTLGGHEVYLGAAGMPNRQDREALGAMEGGAGGILQLAKQWTKNEFGSGMEWRQRRYHPPHIARHLPWYHPPAKMSNTKQEIVSW